MISKKRISKIGLGTVQFGLNYGVSNTKGQVTEEDVRKILRTAWESGVRVLDTAAAYGTCEDVLGRNIESDCLFDIVTKVPTIDKKYKQGEVAPFIRQTFESSLRKLHQESVYSLMFHDADDLCSENAQESFDTLVSLKQDGRIKKIGVSAYTQEQLERIQKRFEIDLVQVPFNILDQRLVKSGYLTKLRDSGVEIHTRSTFLQGLLLMNPDEVKTFFNPIRPILHKFHTEAARLKMTPLELAISYVCHFDAVSRIIVGVTSVKEFNEIRDTIPIESADIDIDFDIFSVNDINIIDPSQWSFSSC